jgi:hypothetical protein
LLRLSFCSRRSINQTKFQCHTTHIVPPILRSSHRL